MMQYNHTLLPAEHFCCSLSPDGYGDEAILASAKIYGKSVSIIELHLSKDLL